MGQRSSSETIVAIIQAFLVQRTWSQADLARHVGVAVRVVRAKLTELERMGIPFDSEEDHPHVYWSVPANWLPGGVAFDRDDLIALLRLLKRVPASPSRDGLFAKIANASRMGGGPLPASPLRLDPMEETQLPLVEDALAQRAVLRFTYFSASRGNMEERDASVHALLHGPPARFVATCHRDGTLKWFRVDRIFHAKLLLAGFRSAEEASIDEFQKLSVIGFKGAEAPLECAFVVRDPEARWVRRNLPSPMEGETLPNNALRVRVRTAALVQVARFVVGLGGAATVETPLLAALVRELAQGALAALAPAAPTGRP